MSSIEDEDQKKKLSIIEAVSKCDLESLQRLLDSPKFYEIKDETRGLPLLQLAASISGEPVFNYLLSIEDYPLEVTNKCGQTVLMKLLNQGKNQYRRDFALKLIEKGANIHVVNSHNNSLLHGALSRGFLDVAKLLLEKGIAVDSQNDDGCTPLHMCGNSEEAILMLLYFGADPAIRNRKGLTVFDELIWISEYGAEVALENLFYCLFDEHTVYDISAQVLLTVAAYRWCYFDEIVKHVGTVFIEDIGSIDCYCRAIFEMKPERLRVLVEKFDHIVQDILYAASYTFRFPSYAWFSRSVYPDNFYLLMEGKLEAEFIDMLCNVQMEDAVGNCIKNRRIDESSLTKFVCFLVSYGMRISIRDLCLIFKKFGYCELFRILLHMDIVLVEPYANLIIYSPAMVHILFSPALDVQSLFKNPVRLGISNLRQLLPFYTIPKLMKVSPDFFKENEDFHEKVMNQPQIPLLVELSRNAFRTYFVKRLNIKSTKQFYTLINSLRISTFHKKIITLEIPLY